MFKEIKSSRIKTILSMGIGLLLISGGLSCKSTEPEPDIQSSPLKVEDITGSYVEGLPCDSLTARIEIKLAADSAFDFTAQYFPFMWPFPELKGRIVNNELVIPTYSYSGNMSSPGGTPRLYSATFSATGQYSPADSSIAWEIDYSKTGFLAEEYQGPFTMYRCP